ncbi:MAG: hypothetical protein ABL907_19805 [Hyphomicrobium sp.]
MEQLSNVEIAQRAVDRLRASFPDLTIQLDEVQGGELFWSIPEQAGVASPIALSLQNSDELTFDVRCFTLTCFPCAKVSEEYLDAVIGYLSGKYRLYEHYRGSKCVKAELQKPLDGGWKTISAWSRLALPFPWTKTYREFYNRS